VPKPDFRKVQSKILISRVSRAVIDVPDKQEGSVLHVDATKVKGGTYDVGGKQIHTKVVGKLIVVRTGGGWTEIRDWFKLQFDHDGQDLDVSDVFGVSKSGSTFNPLTRRGSSVPKRITVRDVLSVDKVLVEEPKAAFGRK